MIRRVLAKDVPTLEAMHKEAGHDFAFPADAISAWVWVDANDEPVMMAGARVLAEAVLISGKQGTPQQRLFILERLLQEVKRDVAGFGIREGVAWIPDGIYRAFSRRLKWLGWKSIRYRSMVLELKEE